VRYLCCYLSPSIIKLVDFVFSALLPWCAIGFLGYVWRVTLYKKDGRVPHKSQIYIDMAFGLFTIVSILRSEV